MRIELNPICSPLLGVVTHGVLFGGGHSSRGFLAGIPPILFILGVLTGVLNLLEVLATPLAFSAEPTIFTDAFNLHLLLAGTIFISSVISASILPSFSRCARW
jgi:hypothetical protein